MPQTAEKQTEETINPMAPFERMDVAHSRFGSAFLESTHHGYERGLRSFIATEPTSIWRLSSSEKLDANWRGQMERFLSDQGAFYICVLSYEFGLALVTDEANLSDGAVPFATVLKYTDALEFDSEEMSIRPDDEDETRDLPPAELIAFPDRAKYRRDIQNILSHIREGDIYQANYTVEWRVRSNRSPWDVYRSLRKSNPGQFAAFINLGDSVILSASPERFFARRGDELTTNPIKGTVAAVEGAGEAAVLARLATAKNRAELLMIVDLLRNDLGKIAEIGSVEVLQPGRIERYRGLAHLVATITARTNPQVTTADLIQALFPCGSITGAPKRRAMEILAKLEGRSRGVYTGAIGYVRGGDCEFNVAIRTITYSNSVYTVQAGGGIIADSNPDDEYEEACLKARNLLAAIDPDLEP